MNIFTISDKKIKHLHNRVKTSNESPQHLLKEFYALAGDVRLCSDLKTETSQCYYELLCRLSDTEIKQSINFMLNTESSVLLFDEKGIQKLIKFHPELADWLYEIMKGLMTKTTNGFSLHIKQISGIIVASIDKTSKKLFKDFVKISDKFRFILVYAGIDFIYKNKPNLRKKVLNFIKKLCDTKNESELIEIYNLMNKIILIDKSISVFFLELAERTLSSTPTNKILIKRIVDLLSEIYDIPEVTARANDLLTCAQKLAGDDIKTVRVAARKLGQWDLLHSNIKIGQRIKSNAEEYNWRFVQEVPVNKPCVIMFGGDGTTESKSANGYLKKIETKLNSAGLSDVNLFGVVYDFGDTQMGCNPLTARKIQMKKYQRKVCIENKQYIENISPEYINQLFDILIMPRISKDNNRLPLKEATKKIRNLNVVAHCHGAYTFFKLEEKMQQAMTDLGYSDKEKQQIQKQFVCIAHAPYYPLGASKSTMVSFASIKDYKIEQYNHFLPTLQKLDRKYEYKFSFFSGKYGDIFVAPQIFDMWFERDFAGLDTNVYEHDFTDYNDDAGVLTYEGIVIKQLSGNALVNAVKSSENNTSITDIQNLVCGDNRFLNDIFNTLRQNGVLMYQAVLKKLRTK